MVIVNVYVIVERVARQDTYTTTAEGRVGEQGVWVGLDGGEDSGQLGWVDTIEIYEGESREGGDVGIGLAASKAHGHGKAEHAALELLGLPLVASLTGTAVGVSGYLQRGVVAHELNEVSEMGGLGRLVGKALEGVERVHGKIYEL